MSATAADAAWAGHGFGHRRRLPLLLRTEAADCGLASIAMVGCYYGTIFEATSHLDAAKECEVYALVKRMNIARLVFAHRPETLANAD